MSLAPALIDQGAASLTRLSAEQLALLTKAAADPLRLRILRVLRNESFSVLELCRILDLAQPKLSHHLKVLLNAGLVATRREGNSIFYRRPLLYGLKDPIEPRHPIGSYVDALFGAVDDLAISAEQLRGIEQTKAERAQSSLEFFEKHADEFAQHQALIVDNRLYLDNLQELVSCARLTKAATAIEVGPGEGDYLLQLAQSFHRVVALDNSPRMLEIAKTKTAAVADKIEFVLGELPDLVKRGQTADLLVMNMVLHHIASPASLIRDAAAVLGDGGYLILAELGPHNQEWVKSCCGDLWLGFALEDLTHWAQDAGLALSRSLYLGLRNGFQIQLHLFHKLAFPPA